MTTEIKKYYDHLIGFKDSFDNDYLYDYWNNRVYHLNECLKKILELTKTLSLNQISHKLDTTFNKNIIQTNSLRAQQILNNAKKINALKNQIKESSNLTPQITDKIITTNISNVRQLTLEVTQACNFRCDYCIYSGKYQSYRVHNDKNTIMSFSIAKKAIDYFVSLIKSPERTVRSGSVTIGFYGGEPILGFDLIKKCVDYVKAIDIGGNIYFSMTSNGSLLTRKVLDFLVQNKFILMVSLDGPELEHNRFRKFKDSMGTFKTVWENIQFLRSEYSVFFKENVRFSLTYSESHNISEIEKFFSENFPDHSINVSTVRIKGSKRYDFEKLQNKKTSQTDTLKNKYFDSVIEGRKISKLLDNVFGASYDRVLNRDSRNLDDYLSGELKSFGAARTCFPGAEKIFVNPSGTFFICERVNKHFSIGDCQNGFDFNKIKQIVERYSRYVVNHCLFCTARRLCSLCISHQTIGKRITSTAYCDVTKITLPEMLGTYIDLFLRSSVKKVTRMQ